MFSPLFSWKLPKLRNLSLIFIKPDQKCESPGLFWTCAIGLSFMYFLFRRFCQRPSSLISLNNHLLSKHWFWMSKFFMPKPPWSFGWHRCCTYSCSVQNWHSGGLVAPLFKRLSIVMILFLASSQRNLNTRGDNNFPNSRNIHRLNPSELYYGIKWIGLIPPPLTLIDPN